MKKAIGVLTGILCFLIIICIAMIFIFANGSNAGTTPVDNVIQMHQNSELDLKEFSSLDDSDVDMQSFWQESSEDEKPYSKDLGEEEVSSAQQSSKMEESYIQGNNGHIVAIDPGHQGSWVDMSAKEPIAPGSSEKKAKCTAGATGRYSNLPEYQLNLDVSLKLKAELERRGYTVVMTRTDNDTAISNSERALMAYENGADVYLRIHANGSDDTSVKGALGMISSKGNKYVGHLYDESYALSNAILDEYCKSTGFKNLGIQHYDNMTGINWSKIPVTILEMGFMSNESDDLKMADSNFQNTMVEGIANGLDKYFE